MAGVSRSSCHEVYVRLDTSYDTTFEFVVVVDGFVTYGGQMDQ